MVDAVIEHLSSCRRSRFRIRIMYDKGAYENILKSSEVMIYPQRGIEVLNSHKKLLIQKQVLETFRIMLTALINHEPNVSLIYNMSIFTYLALTNAITSIRVTYQIFVV